MKPRFILSIHPNMVWGDKMAYLKLMMDEKEIAHLSEMGSLFVQMRVCRSMTSH